MAVLSLKDVGYTYEKTTKPVFRGLSADFEAGRVYCIVGKSGAGKTSLLSLLAGLDTCTEGTILYEGEDLSRLDRGDYRAKKIGVVFQGYNLLLNKSALENIELSMAISGVRRKDSRAYALALLESVGIDEETAGRRVLSLSGGEQQRVAIARALASEAPVILADEPTGNLDEDTAQDITDILKESAHRMGKCVVVVTHSNELAKQADVVFRLRKGELQVLERVDDLSAPHQSRRNNASRSERRAR